MNMQCKGIGWREWNEGKLRCTIIRYSLLLILFCCASDSDLPATTRYVLFESNSFVVNCLCNSCNATFSCCYSAELKQSVSVGHPRTSSSHWIYKLLKKQKAQKITQQVEEEPFPRLCLPMHSLQWNPCPATVRRKQWFEHNDEWIIQNLG